MKLFFVTDSKRNEKKKVDELLSELPEGSVNIFNVLITGNGDKTESYVIEKLKPSGIGFDIFNREIEGDNIYTMMLNLVQEGDTVILLMNEENEAVNKILEEKSNKFTFNIINSI